MSSHDDSAQFVAAELQIHVRRFLDSQDAIKELATFALAQGSSLDSDEAAAAQLAKVAMPPDVSPETASKVYQVVKASLSEQHRAVEELGAQEARNIEEGMDAAQARKEFADAAEQAIVPLVTSLGESLEALGIVGHGRWEIQQYAYRQTRKPRVPLMLDSLLTAAVSDFENFIAGVARASYRFRPRGLKESASSYTWSEVSAFANLADFTEFAIDEQVAKLMRGSLDDWLKFISRATRMPLSDLEKVADPIREVLQRRHIITHNDGRVSRAYLKKTQGLPGAGNELSVRLEVDVAYLDAALDKMGLLAIVIGQVSLAAVSKGAPMDHLVEGNFFDHLVLDLLKLQRYPCVAPLMGLLASYLGTSGSVEILRVNSWIARSKIDGTDSIRKEVEAWDVSSLREVFSMAKSVLLLDLETAERTCQTLLKRELLTDHEVATWPLLEPLREFRSMLATESSAGNVGSHTRSTEEPSSRSAVVPITETDRKRNTRSSSKRTVAARAATSNGSTVTEEIATYSEGSQEPSSTSPR